MATLVYSDVDGIDRSFALGSDPITIGRAPECTIRSQDPRVSRVHARFYIDDGVLWVEDAGSANGIYVGPNRVQRAPVPTGEIILVGSLMIRLLPVSGTLPPPMGLHGTLATWLELERKNRVAIEDERDAFARRVGELHQLLAAAKALAVDPGETAPDMQTQTLVGDNPEVLRLRGLLDEARSTQSATEHAHGEAMRDAVTAREELDRVRKTSMQELEALRVDLAKLREAKLVVEMQGGMAVAANLAETDLVITNLRNDLADARKAAGSPDARVQPLADQIVALNGRIEKADKELASAQIRAQGAERNLSHANATAAKAEAKASQFESRIGDAEERAKVAEQKRAEVAERIAQLETRVGAGDAPLQAAEARSKQLAADLAAATAQLDVQRDKLVTFERQLADKQTEARNAEAKLEAMKAEVGRETAKVGDVGKRAAQLEAQVATLGQADVAIAAATKGREDALARAQTAEIRATQALVRVDESDKRSSAAETMAKSMAKDVAEALRRAAEADSRAKAVARDLAEAHRRAEVAEQIANAVGTSIEDAGRRAAEAETQVAQVTAEFEARFAKTEKAFGPKLEEATQELRTKLTTTEKELGAKLEQAQRSLAAEHSTARQLVDRKTQLERELADTKVALPALTARAQAAETIRAGLEAQIGELQDRVDDLESGLAVAETAHTATSDETRAKVATIERELATARATAAKSTETSESLRVKLALAEGELKTVERTRVEVETALRDTRAKVGDLERLAGDRASAAAESRDKLDQALVRVKEIEDRTEGLSRSAEAADLAIGRAGALQRQLDEAISKLAWFERELATAKAAPTGPSRDQLARDDAALASAEQRAQAAEDRAIQNEAQIASAEQRVRAAEDRVRQNEAQTVEAVQRARGAEDRLRQSESQAVEIAQRAKVAEQRAQALELELGDVERRVKHTEVVASRNSESRIGDAERRSTEAERRAAEAEQRIADAERRAADAEGRASQQSRDPVAGGPTDRKLFDATKRIAELERELAKADNVRSFAAETEREIAQFQRDLRETRTKLTQMTLERDRMDSELRDSRGDSDTTNRKAVIDDRVASDAAATAATAKLAEAEQRSQIMLRDNLALKKLAADLEARLAQTQERLDDQAEATATGNSLPMEALIEHVNVLEESIDSLRANMRAASDETALMDPSDSVIAVSSAVSQAAEHIERARAAIRVLVKSIH